MKRKFKKGDNVKAAWGDTGVIVRNLSLYEVNAHPNANKLEGIGEELNDENWYEVDFYRDGTDEGKEPVAEIELERIYSTNSK